MDIMRGGSTKLLVLQLMILNIIRAQHDGARLPPTITKMSPDNLKIYRADEKIPMECEASGVGSISYRWTKNNSPLELNNFRLEVEGSGRRVTIKEASGLDAGYYQCIVSNDYGKAMSNTTILQMATVGDSTKDIRPEEVEEGRPFKIMSQPHKSFPQPQYSWEIAVNPEDPRPNKLILDERTYMDVDGNLYFAYAKLDDDQSGRIYKLITFNQHLDRKLGGSYTRVHVKPQSTAQDFAPLSNHSFPSRDTTYIGVVGRNITLPCYFAAKPVAEYIWSKPDSSKRADSYEQDKKELVIRNINPDDEGVYFCTARNRLGSNRRQLTLEVEAAPTFSKLEHRPRDTNATEGDTVTFTCIAEGEPVPSTVWYMNGIILDPRNTAPRMRFTKNNQNLVIDNVCRDCRDPDRSTDLMVIQCNASNTHGYILATGYLNVLKKTKVTLTSGTDQVEIDLDQSGSVEFNCEAESDPSTPVAIQWRKIDPNDATSENMVHPDNKVSFINGGQLRFVVDQNGTSKWDQWLGEYKCEANNSYSSDFKKVGLYPKGGPKVRGATLADKWWIFVVIAIILLILILILCCYVYMQRNEGDSYPVDEKERKNGNDPEREIEDSGFQDYRRPDAAPLRSGSVSSSTKLHSDDGSSQHEFGDDPGRFTEDGSFLGAYTGGTTDKKKGRYEY